MRKIFSLAVIMIVVCTSLSQLNAQSSTQVAVLKHDSTLTAFYGKDAFVSACNAADTGDVITLSKGSFNGTNANISKKLTIRGAGMETDGTLITDNIYISADSLTLEGLYFTSTMLFCSDCHLSMTHVSSYYISYQNNAVVRGMIANSRIRFINLNTSAISYVNSYIQNPASSPSSNYVNCIIYGYGLEGSYDNCILIDKSSGGLFSGYATTSNNCVTFHPNGSNYSTGYGIHTNLSRVTSSIFQNFQTIGSDLSFQSFELTDSSKTTYLGGDNTQVGWYGGYVPFTKYSTPRISNLSVSRSTTTDGQLSISVTIDDGTTNNDEE